MIDANETYGDDFATYTHIESSCCTPKTNTMLHVNYIAIKLEIMLEFCWNWLE